MDQRTPKELLNISSCDTQQWNANNCPVRDVMNQIAGKWATLLLLALSENLIDLASCGASCPTSRSAC